MNERVETIQNLIKEVTDVLRETRKIQIEDTRLIRRSDAEIAIQKLNSATELLNKILKDLTAKPEIKKTNDVDVFKKIIEEQRKRREEEESKKWVAPYRVDYEPLRFPDPMKPWWQQGATAGMLEGIV